MKRVILWLGISLTLSVLCGVDVPLFVDWAANNRINRYPQRETKKTDWNEKYRIAFGIDSLVTHNAQFDLRFKTKDAFTDKEIILDRFRATYYTQNSSLELSSQKIGYGSDYLPSQLDIASGYYDTFLYKEIVFNGMMLQHHRGLFSYGLGVGGNIANQSVVRASVAVDAQVKQVCFGIAFRPIGITQDSHWDHPIVVGGLESYLSWGRWDYRSDLAMGYITEYPETIDRYEYFTAHQINTKINRQTTVTLFGSYSQQGYFPTTTTDLIACYKYSPNQWALYSILEYYTVQDVELFKPKLRLEYEFVKGIVVGMDFTQYWLSYNLEADSFGVNTKAYYEF